MDGVALMFWVGVGGVAIVVVAMLIERSRFKRYERGDFEHARIISSLRDRAREDRRHPLADASKSVPSP